MKLLILIISLLIATNAYALRTEVGNSSDRIDEVMRRYQEAVEDKIAARQSVEAYKEPDIMSIAQYHRHPLVAMEPHIAYLEYYMKVWNLNKEYQKKAQKDLKKIIELARILENNDLLANGILLEGVLLTDGPTDEAWQYLNDLKEAYLREKENL